MIRTTARALDIDSDWVEHRVLLLNLSRRSLVGLFLLGQVFVLVLIAFGNLGIDVPVIRPVITFLYLTLVPGFFLLRTLDVKPQSTIDFWVYVVGTSLAYLVIVGVVINFTLLSVGVGRPLEPVTLTGSLSLVTSILVGVYFYLRPDDIVRIKVPVNRLKSPLVLGLLILPFLGIYGALGLLILDTNALLLVLYLVIAAIPVLVISRVIPADLLALTVWVIAISLLLQNTLSGYYLAWGDQPKEAALVRVVMTSGFWSPTYHGAFANKYAMLRITILHPIYTVFTGLELRWVFKLVHPVLFSITPVAIFQGYRKLWGARTSFLATFLWMSLFSFFIVLSRNTRTASALTFLALILLLIVDRDLPLFHRKVLGVLFALMIVVSHYGISYMVQLTLVLVIPVVLLTIWMSPPSLPDRFSTPTFVVLYFVLSFTWYTYFSPQASTFDLLFGFLDHFVTSIRTEFFSSQASASVQVATRDWQSVTLEVLRQFNFLIGGVIGLGLAMTYLEFLIGRSGETSHLMRGTRVMSRIQRESEDLNPEFVSFALVFLFTFGLTFLPVERFNTARTFPTSLLFFAPFFVVGVGVVLRRLPAAFGVSVERRVVLQTAAVLVLIYFLLNVGFVSATLTHEYSPNALVEKGRIADDGRPEEKSYFYKQYPTVYDVAGTEWLRARGVNGSTVYESAWPGNMEGDIGSDEFMRTDTNFNHVTIGPEGDLSDGYVYFSSFTVIGGVVKYPAGHFEFKWAPRSDIERRMDDMSKIYANGGSEIFR